MTPDELAALLELLAERFCEDHLPAESVTIARALEIAEDAVREFANGATR